MSTAISQPLVVEEWAQRPVDQQEVLAILESAVWAPNDGLREPWRFIYVDGEHAAALWPEHPAAPAHLIVIAMLSEASHKQLEDLCAVYGLIQNIHLLAWERQLSVRTSNAAWIYSSAVHEQLKLKERERIAAVLDLGYAARYTTKQASNDSVPLQIGYY